MASCLAGWLAAYLPTCLPACCCASTPAELAVRPDDGALSPVSHPCDSVPLQAMDHLAALEHHRLAQQQQQQMGGVDPSGGSAAAPWLGGEDVRQRCAWLLSSAVLLMRQGDLVEAR